MNHDQSQRDAVASSHGRNARKRPRPKISIVGLQISAPPEHQFHKPRLESSEGLVLFDFSRKPSWEDFTKVATAGTAKDSVVVPIIANENRRFESTAESGEQSNSKAVASSRIATMATADNRQGSDFVGTRNAAVNEPSSLSKEREQIATKSRRESRLKKVHGALVSCSESDSTLEVVSPVSTATLERRNSAHSIGVVHLSETYVATPGLPTVLDIEENSEQGRKSSGSTTANYVEEIDLLSRLDRDISLAEEEDLLHRLDREISLEEEENIMKKLDEDIKKAEVATKTNTIAVSSEMNVSSAPSNDDKTNRSVTDGEVTLLHRMINHTHQQIQKAAAQLSSQKVGEVLRQDSLSSQGEKTVTRKTRVTTGNAAPPNSKLAVDRRVSLKESLHRELKDGGLAFTEEDFNSTFMKGFRREIERDDPSKLVDFEYTIRPSLANKQLVYDLVAKGESSVIVALRSKSKAWVKYRTIMAKINQIVNDGYSKVLDIYARPEHFGIIVMVSGGNLSKELLDHEERGAFFENRNPPGRVATMLGPKATKKGVAIIAADDMCIGSSSDLQVYLQQKEVEGAFVKLTFCMHRNIDLSQGSSPLSSIRRMRDEKRPLRTLTEKLHANKNTNDRQPVENTSPGDSDVLEYPPAGYVLTSALPKSPPSAELGIDDAVSQILENDRSVEVELLMPVAGALGAKLYFKGIKSSGFLHHFSPEGALARTLGKEFSNWGAVLSAVNGAIIRNASDFKEAKQKVGNVGTYRLRLLCYDGIDLSGVDRTRLACPPRRQNGEKYPLHLHVKGGNSLASHGDRSNGPAFMARSISTMSATDKKNVLAESNRDGEGRNANVAILSKHIDQSSISDNKETESMTSRGKHASPPRTSQGGVQNSKTGRVGEVLMEEDPPENTGKKTIYLPYRMKSFGDHDFFSEEQFQMEFMEIFLDEIRKKDPTKVHSLEYSLTRDRARPDKYKFVASGDIATVDELMKRAMAWNRFISATTKLDIIFKDPSSIIAEFNVKTTHSLGFSFLNVRNLSNEHRRQLDYDHPGLWFGISDNEGMIVQKLGREVCSIVAALVAIDGILITREYQVQQLLSQDTTSELAITVCVHKDTPLDRYNQGVKFRLLKETVFFDALRGFPETKRLRSHHAISGEVNSFLEHPPPGFVPTSALPTVPPTNENEFGKVIEKLLKDERSVEIELLLPTNVPLGAQLCYPPKTKGVGWLHRFRPGSTIADIFGNAFGDWGAAVLSINGKKTYSVSHFQTEKGKTKNGEIFRLKLLCFDGVDLSDVDRSKIFNPPRRLNGQKYPMHLHPKISISSDSGTKGAFDASSNIMHQTEKRKIDVSSPNHHEMKKARKSTDVYDGIHGEFPKMLLGPSIPKKTASESNNPLLIAAMDVDRLPSKGGIEQDISGDSSSLDNDSDFAKLSPRKRKALNSSASSLVPQPKLQRTESQTRSIQAKGNGTSAMSNAFDKTFRTNRPLGAYFVTERVDGRNVCKVRSVHVGGQAFREKSIREG